MKCSGISRSSHVSTIRQNQTRFSYKTRLPIVQHHFSNRLEQMTKLKPIFQLALKNKPGPPKLNGGLRHNQPTASAALSMDSLTFRNEYCSKECCCKIFDAPDKTPYCSEQVIQNTTATHLYSKGHESITMIEHLYLCLCDKNKFKHSYLTC